MCRWEQAGGETIEIRPVREREIPALLRLETAIFPDAWSKRSLTESFRQPYTRMMGAFFDGELIGYAIVYLLADDGEIERIAVDERYRRRGVAGRLLDEIRRSGKRDGMQRLLLEVRESNAGAIAFYRKQGFLTDAVRPGYYTAPAEDAILMSCVL